jgi:hypothetical protein
MVAWVWLAAEAANALEADMADIVPFGFVLLGWGSKGNTGRGAAGDASPGSGFIPASGLI